jgi:hypothetical protein
MPRFPTILACLIVTAATVAVLVPNGSSATRWEEPEPTTFEDPADYAPRVDARGRRYTSASWKRGGSLGTVVRQAGDTATPRVIEDTLGLPR